MKMRQQGADPLGLAWAMGQTTGPAHFHQDSVMKALFVQRFATSPVTVLPRSACDLYFKEEFATECFDLASQGCRLGSC